MAVRLKPIDQSQLQTASIRRRQYRLSVEQLGAMPQPTEPLVNFFRVLPRVGEAASLLEAAEAMAQVALMNKPLVWIMDGATMDAGLSPLLVYGMRRGMIQGLVLSGDAALRDYELAFNGMTSEEVGPGLADGLLGMTRETGEGINAILNEGVKRGFSLGECLGRGILDRQPKHYMSSLLATGAARLTPTTVHVTLGADGFHRYPGADGAMLGKGSLKDTQILASYLAQLPIGAMIVASHRDTALNQVFLHAYALARNLNHELQGLHLLHLGESEPARLELPAPGHIYRVPGPLSVIVPLLMGALFSIVE